MIRLRDRHVAFTRRNVLGPMASNVITQVAFSSGYVLLVGVRSFSNEGHVKFHAGVREGAIRLFTLALRRVLRQILFLGQAGGRIVKRRTYMVRLMGHVVHRYVRLIPCNVLARDQARIKRRRQVRRDGNFHLQVGRVILIAIRRNVGTMFSQDGPAGNGASTTIDA